MHNARLKMVIRSRIRFVAGEPLTNNNARVELATMKRLLYRAPLTEAHLACVTSYRYRGVDRSITYRYVLSPIYNRLISLVPLTMAPNSITLIGFLATFSAHVILMSYSASAKSELVEPPRWANGYAALALLFYIVMDNLDGRQARRTGTSSALGHFVDHGFDALNVTLAAASVATGTRMGMRCGALFIACSQVGLAAHGVEEYVTGAMILRELNGPNEGVLALVITHGLAACIGANAMRNPIRLLGGYNALDVCIFLALTSSTYTVVTCAVECSRSPRARQGARVLITPSLYFALYAVWIATAPERLQRYWIYAVWCTAAYFGDFLSRILVAHLAADDNLAPVTTPALALLYAFPAATHAGPVPAAGCTMACVCVVLWRALCVVHQFCNFLGIYCFSINKDAVDASTASGRNSTGGRSTGTRNGKRNVGEKPKDRPHND